MNAECFLDTNVLVYAATGTGDDDRKRRAALDLLEPANCGLSGQVLMEFYVTVTSKTRIRMSAAEAAAWIERLALLPLVPTDSALVQEAIGHARRFQISLWDAAVIAAAERLDAPILYSEDLSHGQFYGAVRVLNPFADLT